VRRLLILIDVSSMTFERPASLGYQPSDNVWVRLAHRLTVPLKLSPMQSYNKRTCGSTFSGLHAVKGDPHHDRYTEAGPIAWRGPAP